jgi:hypothetical protein
LRQEDHWRGQEFEASLSNKARPASKNKKKEERKRKEVEPAKPFSNMAVTLYTPICGGGDFC